MATFTYTADYSATEDSQPRVKTVQYGDGYSQRLKYGLNTDPKSWKLTFAYRTNTERDNIVGFFEQRGGAESFDWTPPRGSAGKYICSSWSVELNAYNQNTINATFVQVFEP